MNLNTLLEQIEDVEFAAQFAVINGVEIFQLVLSKRSSIELL